MPTAVDLAANVRCLGNLFQMKPVVLRLVYQNFRVLPRSVTIHRAQEHIGQRVIVDFDDGSRELFLTAAKTTGEGDDQRTSLYVDERPLAANAMTPSRVQPERRLWNTQWRGRWIRTDTNETGEAEFTVSMQGLLSGELRDELAGSRYVFRGELKSPLEFYAADLKADQVQLSHVRGSLAIASDANSMTVDMNDLEQPFAFRLDLTCSFRG